MKKTVLSITIITSLSIISCKENTTGEKVVKNTTEQNAIPSIKEIKGTYKASVPGANSLMNIELTLNADNTFTQNTTYVDKGNDVYSEKGTYQIDNDLIILNSKNTPIKFKIGEGYLQQLDIDGKEIISEMADKYKYLKQ